MLCYPPPSQHGVNGTRDHERYRVAIRRESCMLCRSLGTEGFFVPTGKVARAIKIGISTRLTKTSQNHIKQLYPRLAPMLSTCCKWYLRSSCLRSGTGHAVGGSSVQLPNSVETFPRFDGR